MDIQDIMPSTLIRKAREYTRLLWVRVVIMGLLAVVTLGLTQLLEPIVPDKLARSLGGQSADRLLQIIANAMLSVTIFSITVMVSVFRSSSTQWTPRVHRLIVTDATTQNTLAVFIGAYVYGLVAIILRELGVYQDERAFVLFVMTVLVLAVIVIYLIRWVLHLQGFGSLIDTTRQIEDVTRKQFRERLRNPCLGANALIHDLPAEAEPVRAQESGYVQHIYPEALNAAAKAHGKDVYLIKDIGSFVFVNEPLVMIAPNGAPQDEKQDFESFEEALRRYVVLGDVRTFDQDPRFGLTVMGEVGSKALSPGVNDPGTAIDVITRLARILSEYQDETENDREEILSRLYVRPLEPAKLIEDGFGALSRDGAGVVEVQMALQMAFSGLMRHPDEGLRAAARHAAERELRRALAATDFEPDQERLIGCAHDDVGRAARS
ncbi:MAG: DUF2254 domain-containing protein [Sulfitobacter sp.]